MEGRFGDGIWNGNRGWIRDGYDGEGFGIGGWI